VGLGTTAVVRLEGALAHDGSLSGRLCWGGSGARGTDPARAQTASKVQEPGRGVEQLARDTPRPAGRVLRSALLGVGAAVSVPAPAYPLRPDGPRSSRPGRPAPPVARLVAHVHAPLGRPLLASTGCGQSCGHRRPRAAGSGPGGRRTGPPRQPSRAGGPLRAEGTA
jgi:hypothetical protein